MCIKLISSIMFSVQVKPLPVLFHLLHHFLGCTIARHFMLGPTWTIFKQSLFLGNLLSKVLNASPPDLCFALGLVLGKWVLTLHFRKGFVGQTSEKSIIALMYRNFVTFAVWCKIFIDRNGKLLMLLDMILYFFVSIEDFFWNFFKRDITNVFLGARRRGTG